MYLIFHISAAPLGLVIKKENHFCHHIQDLGEGHREFKVLSNFDFKMTPTKVTMANHDGFEGSQNAGGADVQVPANSGNM